MVPADGACARNPRLLQTLAYLTEYPTPMLGGFDPAYLACPKKCSKR